MEGLSVTAILRIVAEYGVLGLGWIAWILTMFYLSGERRRYQALVIHIIQHFTKTSVESELDLGESGHKKTFTKLFGKDKER